MLLLAESTTIFPGGRTRAESRLLPSSPCPGVSEPRNLALESRHAEGTFEPNSKPEETSFEAKGPGGEEAGVFCLSTYFCDFLIYFKVVEVMWEVRSSMNKKVLVFGLGQLGLELKRFHSASCKLVNTPSKNMCICLQLSIYHPIYNPLPIR